MRPFTFLIILMIHSVSPQQKCCNTTSSIHPSNNKCIPDENKRLQVFAPFPPLQENTTCLDTNGTSIIEYRLKGGNQIEPIDILEVNFFHKCCPLDFFYNSTTHSCVHQNKVEKLDIEFIKQKFIKVGLPDCKVIVDYNLAVVEHRLELGALFLDKPRRKRFGDGDFCLDKDQNDDLIARACHKDDLKVCENVKCLHKCCPDGQSFVNGQKCTNTYVHGMDLSFSGRIRNASDPFAIIHQYDCKIYLLRDKIQYFLDEEGVFWAFYNKTNAYERFDVATKSYCIEHAAKSKMNDFKFFMCMPEPKIQMKFLVARWAKIVSCIFIIFTVTVYVLLPEMRNLFGKILISYCTATLFVFAFLTYRQFVVNVSDLVCVVTGFVSMFLSLCTFTWLNVMCFDIWWTFGSPKSFFTAQQKKREMKRFAFYSTYGWGTPAVISFVTYVAYFFREDTPHAMRPYLGGYKCFFEHRSGNYAIFVYYATPLILIELANLAFFIKTVMYCLRVKAEINRMNDNRRSIKERERSFNSDKDQLFLILKLGVVMGISFVFEVVSLFFTFSENPILEWVEVIWDTINCLQGLFIFIIFVCKGKVLKLCRGKLRGKRNNRTCSSSVSSIHTAQVCVPLTSKSTGNSV